MWSSFFLVAPPPPPPPYLLVSNPKQFNVAAAQPNRRRSLTALQKDGVSAGQVGELGHNLLTTLQSNPDRRQQEREGPQISGSDVLWALQRASERKKKKKQRWEEESSSPVSSRREDVNSNVDYANVRPLRVKSEWADKLDDLEKRLRELSEII